MKFFEKCKEIFAKKKWVRIVSYVVAAIIILLVGAHLFLGHIIKGSIQTVGPLVTGVPMSVKSVGISTLGDFGVSVKDLVIGNPQGYSSPHALKLGNFQLKVKTFSIFSGKIIVDKLLLEGVEVNFETSLIASNLTDINNNVTKYVPQPAKSDDGEKKEEKAPPKLQVNAIDMSDITVRIVAKGANAAGVPIPMVPIHMKDLGTGPDGITPTALINEMFTKLITGITSLVASGAGAIADGASSAAGAIADGASSAAGAVGDAAKSAGKSVEDAGKNLGKQFKGLFGGDKK